jgi:hypothetical protein
MMLKAAGIPIDRYSSPATLALFLVEFIFSHFLNDIDECH